MWSRCYRRHVIMPFPSFDTSTNSWAPQADISWPIGSERDSEFVRFPIRVMSEREAVACALKNGKSWIDNRLKEMQSTAPRPPLGAVSIKQLHDAFRPATKTPFSKPKESPAGLSFSQFKAAFVRPGAAISEASLRKSYGALMRLQKSDNCSLTEIRCKVKRSQKLLTAFRSKRDDWRSRLPLTQRDWRNLA